ncbi:epoxide hydrolase 4-like [Rhipicephalus sanguineus]|uniref:epoxide hydrolase 4-like n=1 Tax=Rhipicephalus sanguineus TaxID=34632 RepID=UPI0020C39CC6|nr:epoxide hydrolase 4-like [Rhipicephalus sanguineus]
MWIWMEAYVKLQISWHGEGILKPLNRQEPADFSNRSYGDHITVKLSSITVHYVSKGCESTLRDRPVLLLLHGFLDFWYIWNRQIPALANDFWYMIPFRHPKVPEEYLMMRDFAFFDKVHKSFTEREEYIHKYMFSQPGALTGAINYYRAFNNDTEQLNKLQYRVLNVPTLILWGQKDEFLTSRVGTYDREWLNNSAIVFYKRAGHWLLRECFNTVNRYILDFVKYGKLNPSLQQFNESNMQNENTCAHSVTPDVMSPQNALPLVPLDSGVPGFPEE